jgi:hypothetical protein
MDLTAWGRFEELDGKPDGVPTLRQAQHRKRHEHRMVYAEWWAGKR